MQIPGNSYINCGDGVEHFTAAEYNDDQWYLFYYNNEDDKTTTVEPGFPETKTVGSKVGKGSDAPQQHFMILPSI